jgi:hypothetical protein
MTRCEIGGDLIQLVVERVGLISRQQTGAAAARGDERDGESEPAR